MQKAERAAVVLRLAERLRQRGSWCGATHLQKNVFFLKELFDIPVLDFEFILYKHGPFSFELKDLTTSLVARGLLEMVRRPAPYGPTLAPTSSGNELSQVDLPDASDTERAIGFVAECLGSKNAAELERLGTALYFLRKHVQASEEQLAQMIRDVKPHISRPDAIEAIGNVKEIIEAAQATA